MAPEKGSESGSASFKTFHFSYFSIQENDRLETNKLASLQIFLIETGMTSKLNEHSFHRNFLEQFLYSLG